MGSRRAKRPARGRRRATATLLGVTALLGTLGYTALTHGPDRPAARSSAITAPRTDLAGITVASRGAERETDQTIVAGARSTEAAPIPAHLPLPAASGSGRRVVYGQRVMHVWLVDARGRVVRDFPVIGRADKPVPGTYSVYSKSAKARNNEYDVTFRWMVRFAAGDHLPIGFHDLPVTANGQYFDRPADLGKPLGRGGCAASAPGDARFLYQWAKIGTKVVVLR